MSCAFCPRTDAQYVCPRCSKPYCSLICYKSKDHEKCTETFYKEEVESNLPKITDKDKQQLINTLEQFEQAGEEGSWRYVHSDDNVQAELERTKATLKAEKSLNDIDRDDEELSKEEQQELEKLLEESSPDQILALLTADQRRRFEEMLEKEYEVDK